MPVERSQSPEIPPDLLARYAETFIPRHDLYPLQLKTGRYVSTKATLHAELLAAHLRGFVTIGAYALDQQSQAKWLCLDADTGEDWDKLRQVSFSLAEQNAPSYLEPSRRGGHLWLFFPPMPGQDARRLGKHLLTTFNLPSLELFPKQDELRTGPGSFVRLPLGIHRLAGRRYHFVTVMGEPLAPTIRAQLALLAYPEHVPASFIAEALRETPPPPLLSPTPPFRERKRSGRTRDRKRLPSERIKSAVSVFEFVGQYVDLDAQGRGFCPFHDDEHKSFAVSEDGNYWNCFAGCGGGSVIDFWMKWRTKQGEDGSFTATITDLVGQLLD